MQRLVGDKMELSHQGQNVIVDVVTCLVGKVPSHTSLLVTVLGRSLGIQSCRSRSRGAGLCRVSCLTAAHFNVKDYKDPKYKLSKAWGGRCKSTELHKTLHSEEQEGQEEGNNKINKEAGG